MITACLACSQARATVAPAPDFGPNVVVIDPGAPGAQQRLDELFKTQQKAEFDDRRYAVLLKPGRHELNIKVGYYTQVLGLGQNPDDVDVQGTVGVGDYNGSSLVNFWRSVENLSINPGGHAANVWSVSQASPFRRVHVRGDLALFESGYSSGGFLADTKIDGKVSSGSQQQYFSRNCEWGQWNGGVWNMVFVGTPNAPSGEWPGKPYTVVPTTPLAREKPYLTLGNDGQHAVVVPGLRRDSSGVSWADPTSPKRTLPLSAFHIADARRDTADTLNAALAAGKHLLLTPGIYRLTEPLRLTRARTVVMGLGYATLLPTAGTTALTVADVDGVTIAGLLLDAGAVESPALLEVGTLGRKADHSKDPTALFDLFCRVGGAAIGKTKASVVVHSRHVLCDHLWLWRADHGTGAIWEQNTNANGLVVNGDDVTCYGLFVEHAQQYQTLWNGERGRVYFYQCEVPYDPPGNEAWGNDARGFAGYKVADGVNTHQALGLGVYCVFTKAPVLLHSAIEAPDKPGVVLRNMITVRLGGQPGSGIVHTLNERGDGATKEFSTRLLK